MNTAGDVFNLVRSLLEDPAGDFMTDDYLVPKVQAAMNELLNEIFGNANVPGRRSTVQIANVAIGATSLRQYMTTGQPLETLSQIFNMWERQAGGTDTDWTPVQPRQEIPITLQSTRNAIYVWAGDDILLPGASIAMDFKIFGQFDPAIISSAETPLIPGIMAPLQYMTAALVAAGRGNAALTSYMELKARTSKAEFFRQQVMSQQQSPIRQQGFRQYDYY